MTALVALWEVAKTAFAIWLAVVAAWLLDLAGGLDARS